MDQEVLVNECQKILDILQQEHGHISLFMLKAMESDSTDWNLIVSTLEYDKVSTKKAINHLANILNTHLRTDLLKKILRLTILNTSEPFVQEINRVYKVTHTLKYIRHYRK